MATVLATLVGDVSSDPDAARLLTDKIKLGVEATWGLIVHAYEHGAHRTLGYRDWDDYCAQEFGGARLRLPREERQDVVASLRDSGLSTRAIAAATGIDQRTVRRDLDAGEANAAPESPDDEWESSARQPATVTGIDGKRYTPPVRREPTPDEIEVVEHDKAIDRCVKRLEMFCSSLHQFRDLAHSPDRDEILRRLAPSDVEIVLRAEKEIKWKI